MKSGFVALAGRPNVGKSTLVNALCGGKVAIVSDKPQTTRHRMAGVVTGDGYQLVLVDLPGFQRPRDVLTARMQRTVDHALPSADGILFLLAGDERIGPGDRFIAERVFGQPAPVVIALNKVDRLTPGRIARQIVLAAELGDFRALHPVCATTGDGVAALERDLVALLPDGPLYFPPGELTDAPLVLRIAELVREKALELTRDEVPHAITVEVEEVAGRRVRAVVLVETESQKRILVGKDGKMVREIGARARVEIEPLLGHKAFLELAVKVRRRWRRDEQLLARMGI